MTKVFQLLQVAVWTLGAFLGARAFCEETFLDTSPSPSRQAIYGGFFVLWSFYGGSIFTNIFLSLKQRKGSLPDDE